MYLQSANHIYFYIYFISKTSLKNIEPAIFQNFPLFFFEIRTQQFSQIFHAFFEVLRHPTVPPSSTFRQNQSFFSRKHTPICRRAKRVTKSSNLDGLHVATGQHEPCNELARCVHLRVNVYMDIRTCAGCTRNHAWRTHDAWSMKHRIR